MKALRLMAFICLSLFLVSANCEPAVAGKETSQVAQQQADNLGTLIKKHLLGYWIRIKDVSAKPVWFANISPTRYAHHRVYICGAGNDYVVLCYPNGRFYSAMPTADIRLGGLYTDPWYAVDLCAIGYQCAPPRQAGQ